MDVQSLIASGVGLCLAGYVRVGGCVLHLNRYPSADSEVCLLRLSGGQTSFALAIVETRTER